MFKSLFQKSFRKGKKELAKESDLVAITKKNVEDMLISLNEIDVDVKENLDTSVSRSVSLDNIIDGIESTPFDDTHPEYLNDSASVENFDDTKSEVSSIGENQLAVTTDEDSNTKKTLNQINSLQCLFTWNIKSNDKKNIISSIQNKYGEYNLNISSTEFTFERYVGNLIIGYELFHKNESELGQMKVLEIGKWLEELDNGTDEFYLSINTGLQHVMKATFIHMLFATNLTGECQWLLDDIIPFYKMDSKSKATVHAIRAAVFTEYGGSSHIFKRARDSAKKACDLDPNTSYWFYIHSVALTTQRRFLHSHKSYPTENEKSAIQQAIMLSDGKNTTFNYHRMVLDKDTAIRYYHDNKNNHDKSWIENNLQANKTLVQMIRTIMSMNPKDPHLVVKCARTLMTLPIKVRDFNLGKQYLTKAFDMAPNDVTVLKSIEKTVEAYKDVSKKQRPTRTNEKKQNHPPLKNRTQKLTKDLGFIVKKQKNGEDPIPHLTNLISKYDGLDRSKIIAQLCSYTILFTNNLRSGVEEFIKLIEQPGIANNFIISQHFSSFGSRKFNLAELICNEIRLATNSSNTAPEDMLYFFKMLTKIMETCNLQMKDVDSSLKAKLIIDSSANSSFHDTTYQSETGSSDNESVEQVPVKRRTRSRKPRNLNNTGPRVFTQMPEANKGPNRKNDKFQSNFSSRYHQNSNSAAIDQMQIKMLKFLNVSSAEGPRFSNSNFSNILSTENLRNVQTQSQVEQYTHQLYQHISANNNTHQNPRNVPDTSTGFYGGHINPPFPNLSSGSQYSQFQNQQPPSLLNIRPQINPQNLQPRWQGPKKWTSKNQK